MSVVFIDPGHGGVWPKGDPGVVTPDGKKIESYYTWSYANTLRVILSSAGFDVELTRKDDVTKIPYSQRTGRVSKNDILISLHFDSYIGGKRLIYYAGQTEKSGIRSESIRLAEILDKHLKTGDIRNSTSSRFGRLYIDDSSGPAVLIEIDRIDRADDSEEARLDFANKVLFGLREFLGIKDGSGGVVDPEEEEIFSTPFQRVFLIEDGKERQLDISRMSIVGDKLYIALK